MQFNSFIFFLFFTLTVSIYYSVSKKHRNLVLLISNYIFYSYFDFRFSFLLLALTTITYYIGIKINKAAEYEFKRKLLIIGVLINILVLGIFKYLNFFTESFILLFNAMGLSIDSVMIRIAQPLGISFYIFQSLTWIFDNYYEKIDKDYNLVEYLTFSSFFPTVVAGPIERAHRLLPQIKNYREFNKENLNSGILLITYGLFRKVLIGDTIGRMINHIFADPEYFTSIEIMFAVLLYSLQIYNDFAGYSSIAKGVAKILGFEIMLNFRQPYFASSVADFWRRWHISFSSWLRDYIFYPLQIKFRYYRKLGNIIAILITFIICGIWHGPAWNYVLWGILHGIYLTIPLIFKHKGNVFAETENSYSGKKIISIIITYFLIVVAWVLFRVESFDTLTIMFKQLNLFTVGEFWDRFMKMTLTYYLTSFLLDYLEIKYKTDNILIKIRPSIAYGIALTVLVMVFSYLLTSDKAPFIYAQF